MTHGKVRVHELAKELGVTSKEILVACSNYGEFIKSSSSTLEAPLARRLRADLGGRTNAVSARDYGVSADIGYPTVADDGGFGAAYEKARRQSCSPSFGTHKPGAIESAIYRDVIDPRRTKRGGYTPEERDRAQRLTKQWATTWLSDIVDWIRVSVGEHPDVALRMSKEGLTPADAELRLGFGRIDPSRDTIIERVSKGTLGIKDAVRQVQEFRRSERSTGS
jgi:Translation initiation factor IF-2, N-terminal region